GGGDRAALRQAGGPVGRAAHDGARPAGGARSGGHDQGPEGRRGRAGGDGAAAALLGCKTGIRDLNECGMRSAECGMDRALVERDAQHRGSNLPIQFRIPHSALRILLVGALAACGGSDGPRVTVTVPPGATLDAAVDSLAANQVIEHPGSFRLYARLRGLAGSLKSGVYLLRQDESWSDVVAALERGRGVEQRFTVREGLRLAEVAELARAQLKIPRDSFLAAAEDSGLLASAGLPAEVRYDPDRPFVAAVYHNRLKRRMRLEADPTVSYAYGRRLRRVWEKNLAVRSPYNTYLHAGLPPGPIGQPGRAGLVAALYPAD